MAKIVLAMATTHGPQLHTTVEQWQLRVKADQARKHPFRSGVYSFDELVAMRGPEGLDGKSSMEAQRSYHSRCHVAMEKLADNGIKSVPILPSSSGTIRTRSTKPTS